MLQRGGGLDLDHEALGTEHGGEFGSEDLDRDLLPGERVHAELDLAEGADPQGLAEDVVANLDLNSDIPVLIAKLF